MEINVYLCGSLRVVMRVLFVCNNAFNPGNGLSVSALTTVHNLYNHGVDARLMAVRNPDRAGQQPDFPLEHFKFPIFEPIIRANGFCYAKIDHERITEAVEWADVVHLEEALFLENTVRKIAAELGKPCTATFHLYPHNITANLGLGKKNLLNGLLIRNWRRIVYNHCTDIQCPTEEVREYLMANKITARLHVISNGLSIPLEPVKATPVEPDGTIEILCVGRLSNEKSQNTLLEAMRYSRYAERIHITFAGNGPKVAFYRRLADKLCKEGVITIPPSFEFYKRSNLPELARRSYLYIHCAWVEVEGLSCLEATREGCVPVIGEGELISTSNFALCPESRYPCGDSRALAERIDWWIEHPQERNRMAQKYADAARNYDIEDSIQALIRMYRQALSDTAR